MKKLLLCLSLVLFCALSSRLYASHVMGADLTFACQGPNTYLITLQVYRDCNGVSLSGPLTINYSSATCGVNSTLNLSQVGPATDITPVCFSGTSACHGGTGYGIEKYVFQGVLHLPPGCGADWVLSWTLCCRNAAITTLSNPGNENLYIEAHLNNTLPVCDNSPTFSNDPIGIYCINFPQQFNHGATDANGDSLYFYLMPSENGAGSTVGYSGSYSATNPLATTSGTTINPQTGQLAFDPSQSQVAVMKVGVDEYRNGVLIGHIERDMQVIVTNCNNSAPTSQGINGATGSTANTFTTTACSNSCFTIQTADNNATDSVYYSWVGTDLPGATITSSGGLKPLLTICWAPTQNDVGTHHFVINLRNNDCPFYGTSAIAYTVVVNAASDPPVDAGPDVHLCPGQTTTLTATSTGNVISYTWSDGATTHAGASWLVNPAVTTVYTVTAAYANGCALTDQVIVYRNPTPTVSAFPPVSTICSTSDTVQITAIATNAASYLWSPPAGLTCTTCASPKISPTASTTYTVVAYDSAGCPSAPFNVTVNLNAPPPTQSCSVIYATSTASTSGTGTQNDPATLANALALAQCNNALVKVASGNYTIDYPITNIGSNTTIEGGFDPANNWLKSSTPGSTTINRSALNIEGTSNTKRIVAIYLNGAQYVRFQDLTLTTANAPAIAATDTFGISNYVVHMTNCSNYSFVRCQIIPGSGSNGRNGINAAGAGANGANGLNANGQAGGAAPAGPNAGGAGGAGHGHSSPGDAGSAGTGPLGGAGGGGGSNGTACANSPLFGGSYPSPGGAGGSGTSGGSGSNGSAGTVVGGIFNVGSLGGDGISGTNGSGGGGGGATGGANYVFGGDNGSGGGSGGSGGLGGPGGTGGAGGGGCFGIFMNNNGANGVILECNIANTVPGAGGTGGTGGLGGNGGTGGSGGSCGSCCSNTYGNGGRGGNGGNGGNGGSGSNGAAARVYIVSGSPLVTGDSVFNLIAQPTIHAANISCTHKDDTLSSAASGAWTTGATATVPAGNGTQIITQYTATGRKDIGYSGNIYSGFVYIALDQSSFIPVIQSSAQVLHTDTFYVCQGSTANFNMQIASADTFDWNFGGATVPNIYYGHNDQNLTGLTFNTAGTFMIVGRIKTSCCGWSPYDTVYLLVEPKATLSYAGQTSFCPGDSAHITLSGTGVGYQWTPVAGLSDPTGSNVYAFPQVTSTYLVTSYSPRGVCNADTSITVTKNLPATVTFTTTPAACGSTGSATVIPSPAGAYTYTWSVAGSTATISNQPAGTYYVTVTPQGSSCSVTAATSINANGGLVAYFVKSVSPLCYGDCTGQIKVSAIGGTGPYSYHWASSASTLDSLNGLCSGSYDVTITDATGCTSAATQVVSQPTLLSVAVLDSASPHCAGQCTGAAYVDGQGGTGPYSFAWSAPVTSDSGHAVNLCAGHYGITCTDNNGCLATGGVTITTPPPFVEDTVNVHNVTCFGNNDGSITLTVTGGMHPYQYTWPQAPSITDSLGVNLTAQTYTPIVTDSFGCRDSMRIIITQPALLVPTVSQLDSISCHGLTDGGVTIAVAGGTSPFTYSLDATGAFQSSPTFSGLTAGAHQVTVKDANSCNSIVQFNIFEPTQFTSSILSTVNDSCFGSCAGVIVVAGSGGIPPYQYSLNSGTYGSSGTFSALCANPSYTIDAKDNHGCPANQLTDPITQPASAVALAFVSAIAPTCNNGTDGSFIVSGSGGTPGYTFSSDNGPFQSSGSFSPQTAGNHVVTIKDLYGCTTTLTVTVPNPPPSSFYTTVDVNVLCYGGSNGSVTLTLTGTTTPYTYAWSANAGGAITPNINNLPAGTYIVTVKDGNGCIVYSADSINIITQPLKDSANNTMMAVSCHDSSDGSITVAPTGGASPYTHSWSTGAVTPSITGLAAGSYSDTITDANGCRYIDANIIVTQPSKVDIHINSITVAACFGQSNAAIDLTGTGGTPGYTYTWSPSGSGSPLQNIPAGTYQVTVADSHGCKDTATVVVGTAPPMVLNVIQHNIFCPPLQNGSISLAVSGGTPDYSYAWTSGSTSSAIYNLPAGPDQVIVTDSRGCTIDSSFVIVNDSTFHVRPVPDTVTINEGDETQLGLDITFGTGDAIASIAWVPNRGLTCSNCIAPVASPVQTTNYEIHLVSDSGCTADVQILVTVNPQHQIYVPNAFTPNGNGTNDVWEIFGYKKAWKMVDAEVFDRWGEKIFESTDMNFTWDGKYRGTLEEPGLYVYVVKVTFIDGNTVTNKGSISIIR